MEPNTNQEQIVKTMPDYQQEIVQLIHSNLSPKTLAARLQDFHENDIAQILGELDVLQRKKLYRILDIDTISEIFEYLEEEEAVVYFNEMDLKKAANILSRLESDTAADILKEIEAPRRELIIELLDPEMRKDIALIAGFDEEEIGSKLTTNFISIPENQSLKQAMSSLVEQAKENDNISQLFVVDDKDELIGVVDLKDLITAPNGTQLQDLIMTSYPYVYGTEATDDVIERLKDYSEDSIPVLNNDNQLLGVITSNDMIELVDENLSEDYAMLAGLTAEEDLNEPISESLRKRLPWLCVLLALGMLVSSVVSVFETVVSQLTIVMAFQSLILGMSGNVGTQALAVTIRVLMDETLSARQKLALVFKEGRVGFTNGLILGVISTLFIGLFIHFVKGQDFYFSFLVSGCIGLSLVIAMLASSIVGTVIPMFFKNIGVDPAVASGPLITTINDLVAVITYYGLCWLLLIEVFHFGS